LGSSQAGWVVGIALDLRRPAHVVFSQNRVAEPALGHGGREKQGTARNDVLGLADVRDDVLFGLAGAGTHTGQRKGSAHQAQKVAATRWILEFRGLRREFALNVLPELRRVSQFFEAAPVFAALEARKARSDIGEVHRGASFSFGCWGGLAVAHRAADHVFEPGDVVFLLQPQAQFLLGGPGRDLVIHVENLIPRPDEVLGGPVAGEAPLHKEGLGLVHQGHLVDRPMAGVATYTLFNVYLMVEVDKVGQVIYPNPVQGLVVAEARPDRLEDGGRAVNLRVAVHAGLRGRDPRERRLLD